EAGHQYFDQYDLYGNYQHGRYGIGVWGIMGLGAWGPNNGIPLAELFRYPVHFRAAAKEQIGWMALRTLDTTTLDLRLDPIEIGGEGLRIPGAGADLVLEVRGPIGFSSGLPGHGLLIWREDWFPLSERPVIRLVQADGREDLAHGTDLGSRPLPPIDENFGDASDPFPGSEGVTVYEDPEVGVRIENTEARGSRCTRTPRWGCGSRTSGTRGTRWCSTWCSRMVWRTSGRRPGTRTAPGTVRGGKVKGAVSQYGESDWKEAYAEAFSLYVTEPQTLLALRPKTYAYFAGKFPRKPATPQPTLTRRPTPRARGS
ncbi:MAG: hypothetical protein JRI25_21340, partial [Deltaproteobacteria bacterium]|nr:hypothetical protein [Deltaproteobacteria bacterium]